MPHEQYLVSKSSPPATTKRTRLENWRQRSLAYEPDTVPLDIGLPESTMLEPPRRSTSTVSGTHVASP